MKSRLALMPLLIMSAFSYAAEETAATTAANAQQTELQQVEVRADAKRVKAAPFLFHRQRRRLARPRELGRIGQSQRLYRADYRRQLRRTSPQ